MLSLTERAVSGYGLQKTSGGVFIASGVKVVVGVSVCHIGDGVGRGACAIIIMGVAVEADLGKRQCVL